MYKLCFLAFLILVRTCYSYEIQNIPFEDKQTLDQFFNFIINRTSLGYTLCGEKPCSVETYPNLSRLPVRHAAKIFFKYPAYSTLVQGWKVWSQYAQYFPSKKFVFRHVPEYNTVILINKDAALIVIKENLDLFQKYTKLTLSADDFLQEVCLPKDKNKDYLIKYNTALLGILLGYGRNNSLAFTQKSYVQNLKKFEIDNSHQPLNLILNPGFASIQNGTNERENNKIKNTLQHAKRNIKESFQSKHYFETFIQIFTSEVF